IHARNETVLDRVATGLEDDRYCGGCCLCCMAGCRRGTCGDDSDLTTNQIGCQRWQPVILSLCPTILDCHVTVFGKADFIQASPNPCDVGRKRLGRPKV